MAARLGYDGVEVMVWNDPVSQDVEELQRLVDQHGVPILAIHTPCLIITQRVWGTDPWGKLVRAREAAETLGATTAVVHPPFRWQRDYAKDFVAGIHRMSEETDVIFAVENMFPLRARGRQVTPYSPDYDPTYEDFRHFTLDISHCSVSQNDPIEMLDRMEGRLGHLHLADGDGGPKDEHLVPGRGTQPCAEILDRLAKEDFAGTVVLEINTRRCDSREEREHDLAEALAFTRLNLATALGPESATAGRRNNAATSPETIPPVGWSGDPLSPARRQPLVPGARSDHDHAREPRRGRQVCRGYQPCRRGARHDRPGDGRARRQPGPPGRRHH